jgi:hypothetical protein
VRLQINVLVLRPPPYRCYDGNAFVFFTLVVVVLIGPLVARRIAVDEHLRWLALAAIAALLAICSDSWDESQMTPCSPL